MGAIPFPGSQNASSFVGAGAAESPVIPAHNGDKSGRPAYNFPHSGDTFLISFLLLIVDIIFRIERLPAG